MFDRLKNLFRKRQGQWEAEAPSASSAHGGNAKSVTGASLRPPALPGRAASAPSPEASARDDGEAGEAPESGTERFVKLALRPIILSLPAALKARVRQPPAGNTHVAISIDRVISQLGSGSAKISFGELRLAAPAGIFADLPDQDQAPVDLPLNDILTQLPPEFLPRRGSQKRVEVPDDVTPIFGPKGEPLTNIRMIKETGRGQPAPAPAPAPVETHTPPAAKAPLPPISAPRLPAPAPPPSRPAGSAPVPTPLAPSAPIKPSAPLPSPTALRPSTTPAPGPASSPAPAPAGAPAPTTLGRPVHPLYGPKPGGLPQQAAPVPGVATAARPAVPQEALTVPLKSLVSSLPEPIRQALAQSVAANAMLVLPGEDVELGLKRGKVAFTWSQIRTLLNPTLPPTAAAEFNDTAVELPLPVIAPLFLARKKPASAQKKFEVGEDIPDVFQGRGLSPAVTAAAAAAAEVPAPEPPSPAPVVVATAATPKDIGEVFGQPGRKNWTPMEVVQRTSQLNGVAGALIAMQDGLLVAGQLPPGLSAETIAAFIPQMYSRMMQYCKELKFNDASNITVLVDAAPLKIFKAGTVYFTVLGRESDPLPEPHLSIVASHLEPQSK